MTTGYLAGSTRGIQQDQDRYEETLVVDHWVTQETNIAAVVARYNATGIVHDTMNRSEEDSA